MRVLHLFSNYKWTGPAEPAVELVSRLRGLGHEADLAISAYRKGGDRSTLLEEACARGLEPIVRFELRKHFAPVPNLRDARDLARYLSERRPDVVHAHLSNDHLVATIALRAEGRPRLVRSLYEGSPKAPTFRERLLARRTDLLLVPGRRAADAWRSAGTDSSRIRVVDPPLDIDRFEPGHRCAREAFEFSPSDFVVGVVARVQRRRRFDLLLDAFARASREDPGLRLLVVGRGTRLDEVAREPARAMGLSPAVRFAGYLKGAEYTAAIAAMDVLLFLVPGTDGTCRAVREAMAMGKPAIVTRRGLLPEIVDPGRTGFVVAEEASEIARALLDLSRDRERCAHMGAEAAAEARRRYHPVRHAEAVAAAYAEVCSRSV
jgi:glycosyltransferase involved in cell wall biosynthesis